MPVTACRDAASSRAAISFQRSGRSMPGLRQQSRRDTDAGRALAAQRAAVVAGVELGQFLLDLCGVLLLRHADRALHTAVEELAHDGLIACKQLFARAEHDQLAAEEQADVVRHLTGRGDVVGDDQEGRVDLRVQVDDQLVEIGDSHRVEARVRLVEEDDLRIEYERPCQPGSFPHTPGYLSGQLLLGSDQTDHVHLLEHDPLDLALSFAGVLTQREGDVVVEIHRAEQRAVLEEDAEQPPHFVQFALA